MIGARLGYGKIAEALQFAAEQYGGRMAAGTDKLLILRATEMLNLINLVTERTEMLTAAVLYDILTETDVEAEQIREQFGGEVLHLLQVHSEETDLPWIERRPVSTPVLARMGWEEQMLIVGYIPCRERWILRSLNKVGDTFWEFVGTPKNDLAKYFSNIQDTLINLQDDQASAPLTWQMVNCFKDIFIEYWIDEGWDTIYQFARYGECAMWKRDTIGWMTTHIPDTSGMQQITREEAEFMTDLWNHILTFSADLGPLQ